MTLSLAQFDQARDGEPPFADRLLNIQTDIWLLELEQTRIRGLLKIRRTARQRLARHARLVQKG